MAPGEIVAVCTAAGSVLASIGGVIRCLVRILASVERATELGDKAAKQLAKHIEQSAAVHGALTDQLAQHHGRIAGLEAGRPHP